MENQLLGEETLDFSLEVILEIHKGDQVTHKGPGQLLITSERLVWKQPPLELQLTYHQISMQGLSTDPRNFGAPCVICQVATEEEEEETDSWVLKPVEEDVSEMYRRITDCSSKLPPLEVSSEEEGMYYGEEKEEDKEEEEEEEEGDDFDQGCTGVFDDAD